MLADSRYTHLTAKVKGGDGTRVYKRNRMIVTNPVVSRKDPTFNTVTYDWAPTGLTQKLVREPFESSLKLCRINIREDVITARYITTLLYYTFIS